jgi:hypothetical protein
MQSTRKPGTTLQRHTRTSHLQAWQCLHVLQKFGLSHLTVAEPFLHVMVGEYTMELSLENASRRQGVVREEGPWFKTATASDDIHHGITAVPRPTSARNWKLAVLDVLYGSWHSLLKLLTTSSVPWTPGIRSHAGYTCSRGLELRGRISPDAIPMHGPNSTLRYTSSAVQLPSAVWKADGECPALARLA